MTMKEHKSELQQKVITLEHALNQARYELSERAVEVNNTCYKPFFIVIIKYLVTSIRFIIKHEQVKTGNYWFRIKSHVSLCCVNEVFTEKYMVIICSIDCRTESQARSESRTREAEEKQN